MIIAIFACLVVRRACGLVAIVGLLTFARPVHGGPGNLFFPTQPAAPTTLNPAIPATPHPAVARIIVAEKGAQSLGSGTLVNVRDNCGLVITNWHVVRDAAGDIQVVFPSGFSSLARVVKMDKDWDLAALVTWKPIDVQPVSISTKVPQLGEPLTIAGYGSGKYRAATGRCSQWVSPGKNFPFEMVELSAEARQGDSGGPIFNSQGEMAGVLFGASRGSTSGSYCGRVRWFLASIVPELDRSLPAANSQTMLAGNTNGGANAGRPQLPQQSTAGPAAGTTAAFSSLPTNPDAKLALVPVTPRNSAAEPVTRDANTSEGSLSRNDLLAPGLGGYGFSSLPDRQQVPQGLGERITARDHGEGAVEGTAINWRALAGDNPFDLAKTALAVVGALAVAIRLFGARK